MIDLHFIGIGTGNPDHLTAQAALAMNAADLILLPRKGSVKSDLIDLRRAICGAVLTQAVHVVEFDLPVRDSGKDYLDSVNQWHDAIAQAWAKQIALHLPNGGRLAILVWGDPSLYDSSLRMADRLQKGSELAIRVHVVPGITSLQALTAAHGIPLNQLGAPVMITTGRRLCDHGWPYSVDTVAVMLDEGCAFDVLYPEGIHIWWGAYLGMENQLLLDGQLGKIRGKISALRALERSRHGWIMDIYLLQRNI